MSFWQHPAVIGLLLGIPSAALAILGYRRAVRQDKVVEQAGIATAQTSSISQAMEGLRTLGEALQRDNDILRTNQDRLRLQVTTISDKFDVLETVNSALEVKIRELEHEIRELKRQLEIK
jgi:predicted nuclease with TOPRIM domain